jgi:hypothetical protein
MLTRRNIKKRFILKKGIIMDKFKEVLKKFGYSILFIFKLAFVVVKCTLDFVSAIFISWAAEFVNLKNILFTDTIKFGRIDG